MSHRTALKPHASDDAAGYNSGTFYDPDSPSLGAWLQALPADIKAEGLGVAHLRQKTAHRVPGFITQGPKPIADLDSFRASVKKPPQPAVKLTHRYQLSQQAPKVRVYFFSQQACMHAGVTRDCGSMIQSFGLFRPPLCTT